MEKNFTNNNENAIEFLTGTKTATVTFTSRKHITKIKKLYSDEHWKTFFKNYIENEDGSICATIPLKWIKVNPGSKVKREYTEEQRKELATRMANLRKIKKSEK